MKISLKDPKLDHLPVQWVHTHQILKFKCYFMWYVRNERLGGGDKLRIYHGFEMAELVPLVKPHAC